MFTFPLTNTSVLPKLEVNDIDYYQGRVAPAIIDISPMEHPDIRDTVESHMGVYRWLPLHESLSATTDNFVQAFICLYQYSHKTIKTILLCEESERFAHALMDAYIYMRFVGSLQDGRVQQPRNLMGLCKKNILPTLTELEMILNKAHEQFRLNLALRKACSLFCKGKARELLEQGADPNYIHRWDTMLYEVLFGEWWMRPIYDPEHMPSEKELKKARDEEETERLELAQLLIDHGADVNRYAPGDQPLIAHLSRKGKFYNFLVKNGANPKQYNNHENLESLRRGAISIVIKRSLS